MQVISDIENCRQAVLKKRQAGLSVGIVPTLGALHRAHRSLMAAAKERCAVVVVTIFVNPAQFGADEDLDAYPRPLEADLALCRDAGVDIVFAPSVAEISARESARRDVVEAVLALPAKYRDVLVLRYLEGMTPKAIAKRLSLPGATVRSLNARGLNLLRERLDATNGGDRQKWCLALIPLATPDAATLAAGSGLAAGLVAWVIIMKQHALLTSAIAAVALAITATLLSEDGWPFGPTASP